MQGNTILKDIKVFGSIEPQKITVNGKVFSGGETEISFPFIIELRHKDFQPIRLKGTSLPDNGIIEIRNLKWMRIITASNFVVFDETGEEITDYSINVNGGQLPMKLSETEASNAVVSVSREGYVTSSEAKNLWKYSKIEITLSRVLNEQIYVIDELSPSFSNAKATFSLGLPYFTENEESPVPGYKVVTRGRNIHLACDPFYFFKLKFWLVLACALGFILTGIIIGVSISPSESVAPSGESVTVTETQPDDSDYEEDVTSYPESEQVQLSVQEEEVLPQQASEVNEVDKKEIAYIKASVEYLSSHDVWKAKEMKSSAFGHHLDSLFFGMNHYRGDVVRRIYDGLCNEEFGMECGKLKSVVRALEGVRKKSRYNADGDYAITVNTYLETLKKSK